MNFIKFKETFDKAGIFSINNVKSIFPEFHNQYFCSWQDKKYIIKLRNGWYCFPEFLKLPYSAWQTANLIYSPSYISLESALSFYELIPEGIFCVTSVSTNKTTEFETKAGRFHYNALKKDLFFGYTYYKYSDNTNTMIMIAEPEKAILDFLYLKTWYNSPDKIKELRFNEIELIRNIEKNKVYTYLEKFDNKELEKRIDLLFKNYS
ncbi:MAG: hypothetical protein HY738_17450 [Bacteroidia bacterium]|nr:hypothetical protein [Bacteroidia bacterium]